MVNRLITPMLLGCLLTLGSSGMTAAAEKRCGWLENPTPSNWTLTDAEDSWILMSAVDDEPNPAIDFPAFREGKEWYVSTGGASGYGCACLTVTVDRETKRVLTATNGKLLPLKTCRSDRSLPKPED